MVFPERVMAVEVSEPNHVVVDSGLRGADGSRKVVAESCEVVVMHAVIVDVKQGEEAVDVLEP